MIINEERKKKEEILCDHLAKNWIVIWRDFLNWALIPIVWGFPGGTSGKEPTCQCRRHKRCEFYPWIGKTPRVGSGNPLQYSCLENPRDRGIWWATVHRVAQSLTWLNDLAHTHTPTVSLCKTKHFLHLLKEKSFIGLLVCSW